ncbi:hypothetical protein MCUN1_000522 [Malassezia cuniculi]|uniref:Uncharacterized protein n=1 Tax=Malassezia cuniculi TaxID=948313 RepID=A0AAF0ERM7_9BASI|nr:hypothetical protein MCUN1_000522 [Malassezia cuniculi]
METVQIAPATVAICVVAAAVIIALVIPRKKSSKSAPKSTGEYDPATGIGRGAPGFQTNVKRIALPADIVRRIRAGEQVSAEEITAAQERMAAAETAEKKNEWLPDAPKPKSRKGRKK